MPTKKNAKPKTRVKVSKPHPEVAAFVAEHPEAPEPVKEILHPFATGEEIEVRVKNPKPGWWDRFCQIFE